MNSANQGTSWPSTIKPVLVEVEWIREKLQLLIDMYNDLLGLSIKYKGQYQYPSSPTGKVTYKLDMKEVITIHETIENLLNAKELGGNGT